jgi:hypothetical protein
MTSSNRLRLLDANNEGVVTEWLDLDRPAADMWRMSACYSWNMMIAFITIFKVRARRRGLEQWARACRRTGTVARSSLFALLTVVFVFVLFLYVVVVAVAPPSSCG